jgi:AAA domain
MTDINEMADDAVKRAGGPLYINGSSAPASNQPAQRFTLSRFDAVLLSTTSAYLVKGLIPAGGLIIVWGPPKCGKSFWTFDLAMHVALAEPYRGRRVQQGAVVYLALEGGHGFRARIEAWRRQHDVVDAPFYLVTDRTSLVQDHGELITAIRAQAVPDLPRLVVIDTLNRSLAGSESKDEDMAAYIRAADVIRKAFDCAVIIVHHCGIDGTRPRGHTCLTGAADAQLRVERDAADHIAVTVEWLKDGPEGDVIVSALEQVDLGADDDGEAITSCIVVPVEGGPTRLPAKRKLSDRQQLALAALTECIAASGQAPPATYGLPGDVRAVPVTDWRTEIYQRAILDRDAKSPREDFKRLRNSLQARGLIGLRDEIVWRAVA